ncbi:MAG: protein-glutamate O-methyltransferase CheR [Pseudohongiellaceae bacterium]|nr:protein-glutamate O-methyltransferase CheR [Pseudohongiellaceae bacterium]
MQANELQDIDNASHPEREEEFKMSERDFRYIARTIGERAGIVISEVKRPLVYGRLVRRLRVLGLKSFTDYCDIIADESHPECEHFINALTTNLTSFFREPKHFEFLEQELLPELIKNKKDKQLRVWSTACSTGEEPYSIAISIANTVPADWDVKILATDLDSQVLASAARGEYSIENLGGLSKANRNNWFLSGKGENVGRCKVRPQISELVTFRPLNLLESWPMKKPFDIIFCRNVVIYFDKPTQKKLFDRLADQLKIGGHLFIGHSETLFKTTDRFELLGHTTYRRIK